MDIIQVKDKAFKPFISNETLQENIARVANRMNEELADKNPLFIGVLNGSFMFIGDLMKYVTIPCEVTFIKLASYEGTSSTGTVKEIFGLVESIEDRTVVILEDIVDTGRTMERLIKDLKAKNPAEVKIASLLVKPEAIVCDVTVDYTVLEIPNNFIVGYGLDYDGYGRNLKDIYVINE
ncbi:MAG: hypoxanthine phosphoribosyltransferase [Bacteroidales bacterium]